MGRNAYRDWREARRIRGVELRRKGWSTTQVAEALGVTTGAVSQWTKIADEQGMAALRACKPSGRKPRLSDDELAKLPEFLARGCEAWGFLGEVWTRERVAHVIRKQWGVRYSKWQVGRILRRLGLSPQIPDVKASERDEEQIERWPTEQWERIKKKRETKAG